jgi:hypothetical protein
MNTQRGLLDPRKLYSRLRGMATAHDRRQAVLGFLCSATNAPGGHLFLVRGAAHEELAHACSSLEDGESADLIAAATRAWNRELDRRPEDTSTKTFDAASLERMVESSKPERWRNAHNDTFEHRLLGVYRGGRWTPVGIALLKTEDGRKLGTLRQSHIDALCNVLLDAGDVCEVPAAREG